MARRDELRAQIERLPWQKREAINEAVSEGRAVSDDSLALLTADWAAERQREMLRIYFAVIAPALVVVVTVMLWLLVSNDPAGSVGGAVFAGVTGLGVVALILWAVSWRPLVRAEKANLALAGVGEPPSRREPSHWVIAWLVAWPIAAVIGLLLRAVGVTFLAGPLGIVVWFALVWAVKRALDSRES